MRRLQWTILGLLLAAPSLPAQTIESYRLSTYAVGAAAPISTFDFPVAQVQCDQAPPAATAPTVNPTRTVWTDPDRAGRVCQWTDAGTGPLFSVPLGFSYEATLRYVNSVGTGPESNRAAWSRLGPPVAVPGGLRLVRG